MLKEEIPTDLDQTAFEDGFEVRERLDIVRGIIVDKTGGVLIAKRGINDKYPGLWHLVGGKKEDSSTHVKVLEKEIEEEISQACVITDISIYRAFREYDHDTQRLVIDLYYIVNASFNLEDLNPNDFEIEELMIVYGQIDLRGLEFAFGHDQVLINYFREQEQ